METQYSEYVTQTELVDSQITSAYKGFIFGVFFGSVVVFLIGVPTCLYSQ